MNFKPYFKDHLGPEFWVETESRDPVMNHNLKIFERKNNFAVPSDLADFFLDTNGASVKWGDDKGSAKPMGHLSVIKLDKISRIDDGMYALSNCDCCPSTAFDQHGQIFVCDKRGKWTIITDTFCKYFRLALYYGATCGWQNEYTIFGMPIWTREIIWFNFTSKSLEDEILQDSPYPLKLPDLSKVAAIIEKRRPIQQPTSKRHSRSKLY